MFYKSSIKVYHFSIFFSFRSSQVRGLVLHLDGLGMYLHFKAIHLTQEYKRDSGSDQRTYEVGGEKVRSSLCHLQCRGRSRDGGVGGEMARALETS
jgi:hypothetical protein